MKFYWYQIVRITIGSEMAVFHLVYVSKALTPIDKEELARIVHQARMNNKKLDITGILYYRDFYFMQLLEGDEDKVRSLYQKISGDDRHAQLRIIGEATTDNRLYTDWMAAYLDRMPVKRNAEEILNLVNLSGDEGKLKEVQAMVTCLNMFGKTCSPL